MTIYVLFASNTIFFFAIFWHCVKLFEYRYEYGYFVCTHKARNIRVIVWMLETVSVLLTQQ